LRAEQEAQQWFEKYFATARPRWRFSALTERRFNDAIDAYLKRRDTPKPISSVRTAAELGLSSPAQQAGMKAKLLAEGRIGEMELEFRRKDGTIFNGIFSGEIIDLYDRQYLLTVMIDITERKRIEEALRESELLYQSLVETSPLSICRKDLAGRFTFANRRFLEASHHTLADLLGKTDFDLHRRSWQKSTAG
jgi:PAS domain-containing protein